MDNAGIGTRQGAQLAIYTAGFIPSNDTAVFIFCEGLGRTIHDAAGFPALAALGNSISFGNGIRHNLDTRMGRFDGFSMKICTGFYTIVAAITLIRVKRDGIVSFSHGWCSFTIFNNQVSGFGCQVSGR
jgi:hypothetical protein